MINVKEVLERLEKMVGSEFDKDEIVKAFESNREIIVYGEKCELESYGKCTCYSVFEDIFDDSKLIYIYVNEDNKIVKIK